LVIGHWVLGIGRSLVCCLGENLGKAGQVCGLTRFVALKEKKRMSIERFGLDPDNKLGLDKDDVFYSPISDFGVQGMVKLDELMKMIDGWTSKVTQVSESAWFSHEGRECEILLTKGGGWQKGRFRFRLEFIPDNPQVFEGTATSISDDSISRLDDLRLG
jgi:hypothetical protein